MSKARCIICNHAYTDEELSEGVFEGQIKVKCPICGQVNIYNAVEIIAEEKSDDINASGSEGTD